jgi:hypothetical protein
MDSETSSPEQSGRSFGWVLALIALTVAAPGLVAGVLGAGVWLVTQAWIVVPAVAVLGAVELGRRYPRLKQAATTAVLLVAQKTQPKTA